MFELYKMYAFYFYTKFKEWLSGDKPNHLAEELLAQLALCKRLAYNCPLDYIAEPFFILYVTCRKPCEQIAQEAQIEMKSFQNISDEQLLKAAVAIEEISSFLYDEIDAKDQSSVLFRVINFPLKCLSDTGPPAADFFQKNDGLSLEYADNYFAQI